MKREFLSQLTVKELRALCGTHQVHNRSKLRRKQDLIAALLRSGGKASGEPPALPASTVAPAGSSSPAPRPPSVPASAGRQPEPGLPIPQAYGVDRLHLMPQDPHHLFAYWELSGECLGRARQELGEAGRAILLIHSGDGSEQREVDLSGGNYYITVAGGARYQAELALRSSDGRQISLLTSEPLQLAAAEQAPRSDESWMAVDDHFEQLVLESGMLDNDSSGLPARELRTRLWQESGLLPIGGSSDLSSGGLGSQNLVRMQGGDWHGG